MLSRASVNALALMRFGGGHGGGLLVTLFGLAIVGVLVWALTRPATSTEAKN